MQRATTVIPWYGVTIFVLLGILPAAPCGYQFFVLYQHVIDANAEHGKMEAM